MFAAVQRTEAGEQLEHACLSRLLMFSTCKTQTATQTFLTENEVRGSVRLQSEILLMQKMSVFYGFHVNINNDLDPEDEKSLKHKASELADLDNIDLHEYNVYLHQLIIKASDTHFRFQGGLSKRVKKNKSTKQRRHKAR